MNHSGKVLRAAAEACPPPPVRWRNGISRRPPIPRARARRRTAGGRKGIL